MAKIVCPHCGAVNQDISLNDPCWKCGTLLSAPPSALETVDGPPTSAANPMTETKPLTKVQQALAQSETPPPAPVYAERPEVPANRTFVYIGIGVLVLVLVILLLVFVFNRH